MPSNSSATTTVHAADFIDMESHEFELTENRSKISTTRTYSSPFPTNKSWSLEMNIENRLGFEVTDKKHFRVKQNVALVYKKHEAAAFACGPIIGKAAIKMIHVCDNRILINCEKTLSMSENDLQNEGATCDFGRVNFFVCMDFAKPCSFQFACQVRYSHLKDLMSLRSAPSEMKFADGPSPLVEGMEKMYLSEKHSDVRLCINGNATDYPAHKVVLAAHSAVFEAMFEHNMQENSRNRVEINDVNGLAFLEVLRYMYAKRIENSDELVYDVLKIADRYDIKRLKMKCEAILRDKLSAETAMQILIAADTCNSADLKNLAYEFIIKNSKNVAEVMNDDVWNELEARPHLMKNLLLGSFMRQ